MNSSSEMTKMPAAQKLVCPVSAACPPVLMAARMSVVLRAAIAATNVSSVSDPCISRRTRFRKDMRATTWSVSAPAGCRSPRTHSLAACAAEASIALRAVFHFGAARWPGDQQHDEGEHRRDEDRQQKG